MSRKPFRVIGWGPFRMPGEKKRMAALHERYDRAEERQMAEIPFSSEGDASTQEEIINHAARVLSETTRQRNKLIARVRELENRANLIAEWAQHQPDTQGQFRAAVFILTGFWPDDAPRNPAERDDRLP